MMKSVAEERGCILSDRTHEPRRAVCNEVRAGFKPID